MTILRLGHPTYFQNYKNDIEVFQSWLHVFDQEDRLAGDARHVWSSAEGEASGGLA